MNKKILTTTILLLAVILSSNFLGIAQAHSSNLYIIHRDNTWNSNVTGVQAYMTLYNFVGWEKDWWDFEVINWNEISMHSSNHQYYVKMKIGHVYTTFGYREPQIVFEVFDGQYSHRTTTTMYKSGYNEQLGIAFGKQNNNWQAYYYNPRDGWKLLWSIPIITNFNGYFVDVDFYAPHNPSGSSNLITVIQGIQYQTNGWNWNNWQRDFTYTGAYWNTASTTSTGYAVLWKP